MMSVAIGFVSGGLLLLTLGLFIKKGMTFLIAGYDANLVADEKGLANWVGACFLVMGSIGILAGSLVYVLPEEYVFAPVIAFSIAIPTCAITTVVGLQRFTK
jgi:hypothetical protein